MNVRKVLDPVASTSAQPEEHELLDGEQDEDGDEAIPDESVDADWSGDLMCVADPFIVGKVRIFTSSPRFFVQANIFQNCASPIKMLVFNWFIYACRHTEDMLQLGISLESILSRGPPVWRNTTGRPKEARKGRKDQTKKDQNKQPQERKVQGEQPKPRPRPVSAG
jgi:hypothetical protein